MLTLKVSMPKTEKKKSNSRNYLTGLVCSYYTFFCVCTGFPVCANVCVSASRYVSHVVFFFLFVLPVSICLVLLYLILLFIMIIIIVIIIIT